MPDFSKKFPVDANSNTIPVLQGSGNRVNMTAAVASSNAALPTGTSSWVIVRCTDYIWLNFGTGAVTASAAATSFLVPPGEGAYPVASTATHAAILRVGASDVSVQLESFG